MAASARNQPGGASVCAACGRSLAEDAAWKGSGEHYYCNDFCADAEAMESPSLVPTMGDDASAEIEASSRGHA